MNNLCLFARAPLVGALILSGCLGFSSVSRADAVPVPRLEVPLVVVLHSNEYLGGQEMNFVVNTSTLDGHCDLSSVFGWSTGTCYNGPQFNDVTSSIAVRPGPHYDAWKALYGREPSVTLFEDSEYRGASITVQAGEYWDLRPFGWNDRISSVRFDTANLGPNATTTIFPNAPAAPIPSIPALVVLHWSDYGADRPVWFFESIPTFAYPVSEIDVIEVAGMRGAVTVFDPLGNPTVFTAGNHTGLSLLVGSVTIEPIQLVVRRPILVPIGDN